MGEFWTSQDLVSWSHCYCKEPCLINCLGMPTLRGVVTFISICVLLTFFIWVYAIVRDADKIAKENTK